MGQVRVLTDRYRDLGFEPYTVQYLEPQTLVLEDRCPQCYDQLPQPVEGERGERWWRCPGCRRAYSVVSMLRSRDVSLHGERV